MPKSTKPMAIEVNDLVNTHFTMPDGSKRRSLWQRVPDTRPRWMIEEVDDEPMVLCFHGLGFYWDYLSEYEKRCPTMLDLADAPSVQVGLDGLDADDIADTAVVAMAHVSIERWLILQAGEITISDHTPGGVARVTLGDTRLDCSKMLADQSVLRAMTLAAHNVADALGIPKL